MITLWQVDDGGLLEGVALAVLLLAAAALLRRKSFVLRTTVGGPWAWTIAALLASAAWIVAVFLLAAEDNGAGWLDEGRYLAGTMSLAPIMAVLGAKRPQHHAWQWIVLTLLVVLWLPLAQHLALKPGGELQLHAVWQWFIVLLIFSGWINYVATWLGGAATVAAAGQLFVLAPYTPLPIAHWTANGAAILGMLLLGAAALRIACVRRSPFAGGSDIDRAWREFRDLYGAAWALRVMERFNGPARTLGWPVQLHWAGFHRAAAASEPVTLDDLSPEMLSNLQTAFRRFMPPEWIATHFRGA